MRRFLIALALFTTVLCAGDSCKHAVPNNYNTTAEADGDKGDVGTKKLVLNSGAKWKVDLITDANVHSLQGILQKFNIDTELSIADYARVDDELQHGIVKMISECKMKGADHEALHSWLKPLIDEVQQLKKASTAADANRALKTIDAQLNLYSKYFEI